MSEDIEALLRSGLAERADAAPVFDDPGLADLAIAGAGRLRRRRRVAAAAGGAGLLVLGAAVVWNPLIAPHDGKGDGDIAAADTSTVEVQSEFGMEFLVQDGDGRYSVLNEDGESFAFDIEEPNANVYKLTTQYMAESSSDVWTIGLDGDELVSEQKPSIDTYTKINSAGDRYAMITPNAEYTEEEYSLVDVSLHEQSETVGFTTNSLLTLDDWNASTAVFTTDLYSTTGGEASRYWFNDQFNFGFESVSAAGLEAAVLVDQTDPSYVCVADLDARGTASTQEECGPLSSVVVQETLADAAGEEGAEDAASITEGVVSMYQPDAMLFPDEGEVDYGEYQELYDDAGEQWVDPAGRWVVWADRGDDTWLLIDHTGDEPAVSELQPPDGAVMPIVSYT
ncbi:hypothetical protein [Glycomyces algeriensis]|uniref:Uncharacterized protein n=1 Tax=Glycomyces algeriensis TaxID=256037 RepID=A0A9W6G7F3_9ACTN|nr:hypothetical protein [Glycomyces algeriensis]MDA1366162.1 hypothetical protein [Glycomyces algeriensis]MDR7349069.1 hypothetical protein [Glycomyces algeriensis]GLI41770.1 hypothetical protein GALLR39Z86_16200 [Glycomyces algeriensis]